MRPAPYWFTKISRPTLTFFRSLLINVTNYVDDWLFSENIKQVHELVKFLQLIFSSLGWILNNKSILDPCEELVYLGLIIDAENFEFRAPQHKIDRVKSIILRLTQKSRTGQPVQLSDLRSVSGYCVSLSLAIPPIMLWVGLINQIAPLNFTKSVTHTKTSKNQTISLEKILTLLDTHNGNPIIAQTPSPNSTFFLDAGEVGCGVHENGVTVLSEPLPSSVVGLSSTYRELFTVLRLLLTVGMARRNSTFLLIFDSDNARLGINSFGSNTPNTNNLLLTIWDTATTFNIKLTADWICREKNTLADQLSKIWDRQWELTSHARTAARSLNPTFTIHIATPKFTKTGSLLACLSQRLIIIHPIWRSQSWWPLLQSLSYKSVRLGTFVDTFHHHTGSEPPAWEFSATLLRPSNKSLHTQATQVQTENA